MKLHASLIDWISDTRSQGYTDLQSLLKCLDHREVAYLARQKFTFSSDLCTVLPELKAV